MTETLCVHRAMFFSWTDTKKEIWVLENPMYGILLLPNNWTEVFESQIICFSRFRMTQEITSTWFCCQWYGNGQCQWNYYRLGQIPLPYLWHFLERRTESVENGKSFNEKCTFLQPKERIIWINPWLWRETVCSPEEYKTKCITKEHGSQTVQNWTLNPQLLAPSQA